LVDPEYDDETTLFEEYRKNEGFVLPDDDSDLEFYEETYTTPSGETVVAFGEYGYDG